MIAGALWLYARTTRARDGVGRWAFRAYIATLLGFYIATFAGPPPPSVEVLAWSALLGVLFVPWAAWFDRHRAVTSAAASSS